MTDEKDMILVASLTSHAVFKRPHNKEDDAPDVHPKKIALRLNSCNNPVSLLNKLYQGAEFKMVNQEGPVNAPTFTVSVEINGIKFEGKGRNKKTAKQNAAEAALNSLVQFRNPTSEGPNVSAASDSIDFTLDVMYDDINNFNMSKVLDGSFVIQNKGLRKDVNPLATSQLGKERPIVLGKNPVVLLNELHPGFKFEVLSENGEQIRRFTTAITINDKRFIGVGPSKKQSKAAAARTALLNFYKVSLPSAPISNKIENVSFCGENEGLTETFADHIFKLVNDQFTNLMRENPAHIRRKVLAGFVLSREYDIDSCRVLTISTGTKCISGDKMSTNGTVLNDSHAEIISRRCLCNFFYSELEKHLNPEEADRSIFIKQENGFQLHPQYKLHLYINTAPCGDSRVFSPCDEHIIDKHPNRKARGKLRTKIECGEGTIPIKELENFQTWDGILLGQRLLTMSCSDKIAKWNVVGLQGALLSNFVQPVYLDSVILGSIFHPTHLYRAICGRLEKTLHGLPPPYRLNKPKMSTILNPEIRQVGKAPKFSVNWTVGDSDVEVVNALNGRTIENEISRLAKCKLFLKFLRLLEKIPTINKFQATNGSLVYGQCKENATSFQIAKKELFSAFSKSSLGAWVKKPLEVDQFEWDRESLEKFIVESNAVKLENKEGEPDMEDL